MKRLSNFIKKITAILIFAFSFFMSFSLEWENPLDLKIAYKKENPETEVIGYEEIWGYVMDSRSFEWDKNMPLSDIAVFAADVNCYGNLESIPSAEKYKEFSGRTHLVIMCEGRSLTHMVISSECGKRKSLVKQIAKASEQFDGVQLDFENVPKKDGEDFIRFLKEVRRAMKKGKMLSIALPARVKTLADDVYDYSKIVPLVDRIVVMAYDEHWSTSSPGSIASMNWCMKISSYSTDVIPDEKLIMGLPFYGRTWVSENFGKAWYFSGINRILNENPILKTEGRKDIKVPAEVKRTDGIPNFTFNTEVKVTGYFEDAVSVLKRCRLYKEDGISKIAFWRIGQEDRDIWNFLNIEKDFYNAEKTKRD